MANIVFKLDLKIKAVPNPRGPFPYCCDPGPEKKKKHNKRDKKTALVRSRRVEHRRKKKKIRRRRDPAR